MDTEEFKGVKTIGCTPSPPLPPPVSLFVTIFATLFPSCRVTYILSGPEPKFINCQKFVGKPYLNSFVDYVIISYSLKTPENFWSQKG